MPWAPLTSLEVTPWATGGDLVTGTRVFAYGVCPFVILSTWLPEQLACYTEQRLFLGTGL